MKNEFKIRIIVAAIAVTTLLALFVWKKYIPSFQKTTQPVEIEFKAKNYGEFAEAYAKGRRGCSNAVYNLLRQHVSSDVAVLDLGCGTGLSTQPLLKMFKEVYGCDHDIRMLEIAKRNAINPNIFKKCSAYELPYENEKFGLVTMFTSFHWFCDAKAAHEISRVLKKGGFVYVVDAGKNPFHKELMEIEEKAIGYEVSHPKKQGYDPEKMLTENGFITVVKQEFKDIQKYTVEELLQRYQSNTHWHDVIHSGKEKEVLDKLRELCISKVNPQDGFIHYENPEKVLLVQKK